MIAAGYSSVRPINKAGVEDPVSSRRVVFSVTPNRKSLIDEIEATPLWATCASTEIHSDARRVAEKGGCKDAHGISAEKFE